MTILPVPHSEVTISSGGPTQSISPAALSGITPKGVRCRISTAITDGTSADHSILSVGMSDGVRQQVNASGDRHNVGTSFPSVYMDDSSFVCIINAVDRSIIGLGSIALVSGGATITWSTVPDAAYVMDFEFYAGTDMVVRCEVNQTVPVSPGLVITSLSETPELLLTQWGSGSDASDPADSNAKMSLGAYNGTIQRCMSRNIRRNQTTMRNVARMDTSSILQVLGSTAVSSSVVASAFTSSGYTLIEDTTTINGVGIMSISTGGTADISLVDYDLATSTGDDSLDTMGGSPAMVTMVGGVMASRDITQIGGSSRAINHFMFDASIERSMISSSRDGNTLSYSYSLSDDKAIHIRNADDSADNTVATRASLDALGFTLNYTVVSSALVCFAVGFEKVVAAGLDIVKIVNDSESVVEVTNSSLALVRMQNSSVSVAEDNNKTIQALKVISETINIVEVVNKTILMTKVQNETISISESLALALGIVKEISDTIQIAQVQEAILGIVREISEEVSIGEALNRTLAIIRYINEVTTIVEATTKVRVLIRNINEVETVVEALTTVRNLILSLTETVDVDETAESVRGIAKVISDIVSISEEANIALGIVKEIFDTLNIIEASNKVITLIKVISDILQILESSNTSRQRVKLINEIENLDEALTSARDLVRVTDEVVNVVETNVVSRIIVRVVNEVLDISEGILKSFGAQIIAFVEFIGSFEKTKTMVGSFKKTKALLGSFKKNKDMDGSVD